MESRRILKHKTILSMAKVFSQLGTCKRRKVGCIITDKRGLFLATGFNGNPANSVHCIDEPCEGANSPHGTEYEKCEAIHAEQNALLQCKNVNNIFRVYVTYPPCMHCIKLICNTSAKEIICYRLETSPSYYTETREYWSLHGPETPIWWDIP